MRRVALSLVVLAVVGLATSTVLAGTSAPKVAMHVGTTLVAHHGGHGHSHGHGSYRYEHRSPYRSSYHRYGPSYRYVYPPVIVPFPGHPPVVPPPVYRPRPYYYSPPVGLHYQGQGFGISIGF